MKIIGVRPRDAGPGEPQGYIESPNHRVIPESLYKAQLVERLSAAALKAENFADSMAVLAGLRGPIDRFFNKVTVNTDDKELRENRLRLLSQIRDTLNLVADFSLVEG